MDFQSLTVLVQPFNHASLSSSCFLHFSSCIVDFGTHYARSCTSATASEEKYEHLLNPSMRTQEAKRGDNLSAPTALCADAGYETLSKGENTTQGVR